MNFTYQYTRIPASFENSEIYSKIIDILVVNNCILKDTFELRYKILYKWQNVFVDQNQA